MVPRNLSDRSCIVSESMQDEVGKFLIRGCDTEIRSPWILKIVLHIFFIFSVVEKTETNSIT
jgi:hypothetical protein